MKKTKRAQQSSETKFEVEKLKEGVQSSPARNASLNDVVGRLRSTHKQPMVMDTRLAIGEEGANQHARGRY